MLLSLLLIIAPSFRNLAKGQVSASNLGFSTHRNSYGVASDIIGLGVTYGGGLGAPFISYDLLNGYTGATSVGAIATYEHLFTKRFGLGLAVSYANASYSAVINYPAGVFLPAGTLTDTKKGGYIGIASRSLYHFYNKPPFDIYAGVIAGITLTNLYSDTYTPGTNQDFKSHVLYGGMLIGALAGIQYALTTNFSIRLECNYSGVPDYLGGLAITYRIYNRF